MVHVGQIYGVIDTGSNVTRQENGIVSIITGTFLHANYSHLVSNLSVLLVVLPLLMALYKNYVTKLFFAGLIVPNSVCYLLGLSVVGISGFVYAVTWFVILAGLGSNDVVRYIVSIVLGLIFASTLIGITPMAGAFVAWQAHLAGFLLAFFLTIRKFFS